LIHVIKYAISPQKDYNGYLPQVKNLRVVKNQIDDETQLGTKPISPIDTNFVEAYTSFLTSVKENDTNLILVISPTFQNIDSTKNTSLKLLKSIAVENNIKLVDFLKDKRFLNQPNLFRDESHLNEEGAQFFSKIVADTIANSQLKLD
jgi:lysophospholipase L1-like esterase